MRFTNIQMKWHDEKYITWYVPNDEIGTYHYEGGERQYSSGVVTSKLFTIKLRACVSVCVIGVEWILKASYVFTVQVCKCVQSVSKSAHRFAMQHKNK